MQRVFGLLYMTTTILICPNLLLTYIAIENLFPLSTVFWYWDDVTLPFGRVVSR